MYEDLIHCLDEEHNNDKKIVFEYPENDLDETQPIQKVKKNNEKKAITKPISEDTEDLVNEISSDDIEDSEEYEEEFFEEPRRKNTLITILATFFLLLLIAAGVIWIVSTQEVEDVIVPDVVGYTIEEAIELLEDAGFTYTTETANSDTVEIGDVIKTKPKAGSTRKKGDTITIVESSGGTYNYLENYVGSKYAEVKAKLELLGINVLVEKKDVEKKEDYENKEDIIIEQSPAFDEKAEKVLIEKGDTITLYIPNIVNDYPDMKAEGWTLSDVIAFADEYKLNLTVYDNDLNNKNIIPESEYDNFAKTKIIEQSKPSGYTIIEGFNFSVNINAEYANNEENSETTNPEVSE